MSVNIGIANRITRRQALTGIGGVAIGLAVMPFVPSPGASAATITGLDYSFSHPAISDIKAGGYSFVCRYLSWYPEKNLTPAEAKALISAGISIVCNWEDTANEALEGYATGVTSARQAAKLAQTCGQPDSRPIYFSVDFDATPGNQAAINDYFDGVASVIGRGRCGAYGGYYPVQRLFDAGKIAWGWQTYAWSGGQWEPRAQLRQVQNGITVGGVECDLDNATISDYGQWGTAPTNVSSPQASSDGIAVLSNGKIAVYTVHSDGDVWGKTQTSLSGPFSAWQRLSNTGGFAGKVSVLVDSSDRIALYVRRNGSVWGASQATAGGAFGSWISIGSSGNGIAGDPTATRGHDGLIAIYATATNGSLSAVSQHVAGGAFGSWSQIATGGGYTGKPASIVDSDGTISVYVQRNNSIWGATQAAPGGAFGSFIKIGTSGNGIFGDPAAVYGHNGLVAIYAVNTAGNVSGVSQRSAGGAFGSWSQLTTDAQYVGKPSAISDRQGQISLFVRHHDGIWGSSQSAPGGSFGDWAAVGTNDNGLTGDPIAAHWTNDRFVVYAPSTTNNVSGATQQSPAGSFGSWAKI